MPERANPPALWSPQSFNYLSGLLLLSFSVNMYSWSLCLSMKGNLTLLIIFGSLGWMPPSLHPSYPTQLGLHDLVQVQSPQNNNASQNHLSSFRPPTEGTITLTVLSPHITWHNQLKCNCAVGLVNYIETWMPTIGHSYLESFLQISTWLYHSLGR